MSERKINIGTHTSHCCKFHGCKYGDGKRCPVENLSHQQEYGCEFCPTEEDIRETEERLAEMKQEMEFLRTLRK